MDILRGIADNPALLEALRKTIEDEFALDIDTNQSNELLGEKVRATIEGLAKVKEAFRRISEYRTLPKTPEKVNRAI